MCIWHRNTKMGKQRMKAMWRAMANQAKTRSRSRWLGPLVSGWLFSLGFLSLAKVIKSMSVWTRVIKSGSSVRRRRQREPGSVLKELKKLDHHNAQQWQKKKMHLPLFFVLTATPWCVGDKSTLNHVQAEECSLCELPEKRFRGMLCRGPSQSDPHHLLTFL